MKTIHIQYICYKSSYTKKVKRLSVCFFLQKSVLSPACKKTVHWMVRLSWTRRNLGQLRYVCSETFSGEPAVVVIKEGITSSMEINGNNFCVFQPTSFCPYFVPTCGFEEYGCGDPGRSVFAKHPPGRSERCVLAVHQQARPFSELRDFKPATLHYSQTGVPNQNLGAQFLC